MVFAPPQHGKSELVSRRLPAYILGRNPDASIIANSYSDSLASRMNRDVQGIMDSERYSAVFPQTKLFGKNVRTIANGKTYLRNSDEFEVVGYSGGYRSAGVGSGITGRGCDFGIIDDPLKDDEEAYSPTIRRKVMDWYRGTFYTRLRKDARVLLTLTRWHREDPAGVLLAEMESSKDADQWTVLTFEGERTDASFPYDPRKPGEPLWPAFKSREDLASIKATLGPTKWAAMYQQSPRAAGGAEWPEEYFDAGIWFDEWPKEPKARVVCLDPSKGKDARWGDYSAFIKLTYKDGTLYVDADMANDRNTAAITDTAVEIQREFRADAYGVEINQFQELLADNIAESSRRAGIPLPIYGINNNVKKEVRIRRLSPYLAQKMIRFKGGSPGARLLVQQLRDFPNGDHDDGPDALEMAVRLLLEIVETRSDGLGNRLPIGV